MDNKSLYMVRIKTVKEKKLPYGAEKLDDAEKAYAMVRPVLEDSDKEMILTVCVDSKLRPVSLEKTAVGTSDRCPAYPKEIDTERSSTPTIVEVRVGTATKSRGPAMIRMLARVTVHFPPRWAISLLVSWGPT